MQYDFGKYYFIQEYKDSKITHEFSGESSLDDMIQNFEMFLKGSGYHFEGHLDIVYDEEESCPECGMVEGHKMSCSIGSAQRYEMNMDVAGGSFAVDTIDIGDSSDNITISIDTDGKLK